MDQGVLEGVGRKAGFGVQALVDGKSRLVLNLGRLAGESEEGLRAGVEQLASRGIGLELIRAWLWDGLHAYPAILAMLDLGQVPWQRSVLNPWRNLAEGLKVYNEAKGEEAVDRPKDHVRAVWDAKSERAAVVALMVLVKEYGKDPLAERLVGLV